MMSRFYRAMLCIRGTSHEPVSVRVCVCPCPCLSQAGVLLKRQNLGSPKQHHTWQLARFQLTRRIARSLGDSWASCVFYDGPPSTQRKRDVMLSTCFISSTSLFGSDHLCRPKRKHSKFENHIFFRRSNYALCAVSLMWHILKTRIVSLCFESAACFKKTRIIFTF